MDIFKAEKTGNLRKVPEVVFLRRKSVSCRHAATREVADRKKAENPHEKQNPGSIDLQCPGESKWRDYRASLARNLNRRDCPPGRSLVSVEKAADELSSTGGRRLLSPRPFGPEFEDLDFRPSNANFRHFPPVVQ